MSISNYKPHLAVDAKLDKLIYPLTVLLKVDGVRMEVQDGVATGRSMKKYKNKALTSYFSDHLFDGFSMEVGCSNPNDPHLCNNTTSLVNTIVGGLPNFVYVFDYITEETVGLEFLDRMSKLKVYLDSTTLPDDVHIIYPEIYTINNEDELLELYQWALDNNYEGLVIRKGLHKDGRCTVNEGDYLRIKPKGDSEGIVIRLDEACENTNEAKINELGHTERSSHKENMIPKGMIGALWVRDIHTNEEVKVGAGKMTHEMRKYYWEHQDEIIGDLVKYAFTATGKKDKPRHPRYISHRAFEDL